MSKSRVAWAQAGAPGASTQAAARRGPGLLRGPWSPSGKRLLVQRFRDGRYQVGIVTLADRSVRWTGLTPEIPLTGAWADWVTDDQVALMVRPDGGLPGILRYYGGGQARATAAWARTSLGREASRTVIETEGGVATAEAPTPDQALVLGRRRHGRGADPGAGAGVRCFGFA